ncbi:MacB family efflux pump subunit [Nitrosomonas sp.]|uniref:MacB family efflux pump subunit n=2 Tax=Nitrosomonas sp. TaxID=42353 RepID=UPI0037CAA4B8
MVSNDLPPLIELRGIRKRYGGGDKPEVEVLHGIDLDIRAGEFIAIVGTSGSGKSTLMHLLGCLDRPSSGSYRFAGEDVSTFGTDELAWLRREAFGFVFQGYHLIPTESARENVEVPAIYAGLSQDERMQRATNLLGRLGLSDKLNNRPNQLSGGQQQRVSIARALMNGGHIILADEPTGALDSRSGAEVMELLRELAGAGHTVILITHDRDVAAQAQRVVEIRDGRIVSDNVTDRQQSGQLPPHHAELSSLDITRACEDSGTPFWQGLRETIRAAWRVMWIHRIRTSLTLLGIVIGVASVIVMLAIGEGTKQQVVDQMGSLGTTIMYMSSSVPPAGGPTGVITEEDLDEIAHLPEISRIMQVIGDPILVRHQNVDRQIYVFASPYIMPLVHHWQVAQGRFFTEAEDRELAPVVILGHKTYRDFFPHLSDPVGQYLLIGTSPFEVIGVMAERGAESGSQNYDDMVFIPYRAGRARVYQTQEQPDYVVMEAASMDQVQEAEDAVRALLLERHGREDFSIGNAAARLKAQLETRDTMTRMLGLVAAVSLLVGGIGVMNVMLMTVRERTREIGIRMATGAREYDILSQFLIEAMLVTIVGGTVGVILGLIVGALLIFWEIPIIFSLGVMIGAFSCAVITGLIFGYMPARTAARLDPVVALSSE